MIILSYDLDHSEDIVRKLYLTVFILIERGKDIVK